MNKHEAITPREVDELNEARRVLDRIAERLRYTYDSDETRVLMRAVDATDAIFDLLVVAHIHCDVPVSETQLHHWREQATA